MRSEFKIPFFLMGRFLRRSNKWTLSLVIFLLAIAYINLIFVNSLFQGVIASSNQQVINTTTGNIVITPAEGQEFVTDTEAMVGQVEQVNQVVGAAAETIVPASLRYGTIDASFSVIAVDPEQESRVTDISQKMIEGSYLEPGDTDQIIIGQQVTGAQGSSARNLNTFQGIQVGDKISLIVAGVPHEFTLKGIFFSKFNEADNRTFITRQALYGLLPDLRDKASDVIVRLAKTGKEQAVIAQLQGQGIAGTFNTWQTMAGSLTTVVDSFTTINALLTTVGFLIAAVTIFIIIYVDISHRRQEIGILRAIGIKGYLVRATYVFQSLVYTILGVAVGAAIFFAVLVPYFRLHPFSLPLGDVTLAILPGDLIGRGFGVLLLGIASGLIPSIIVTRAKILDEIAGR